MNNFSPQPKPTTWRSKKYIAWVKEQPCVSCGAPADDPHHLTGLGGMGGMGTTAPDWTAMPMCRPCHTDIHNTPKMWPMQWEWISRTLGQAVDDGFLVVITE